MKNNEFYTKIFRTTVPITLQSLMLSLVAVSDSLMLGNLEQNYMAAVSLAVQIQFVQNLFLFGTIESARILGSQYWGKSDQKSLITIYSIAFKMCIFVSVLTFSGCVFFPRALMSVFTNESVLVEIGISYLKIAGWSYLLTGISQCFLSIMKITNHPDTAAKISSTAVVLNIILNAVFIFGLGPCPALGVKGAALSTLVSRIVELILVISISFRKNYVHVKISDILRFTSYLLKDFIKVWIPLIGSFLLWGLGFTSYSAFMGHLGTEATAANSICAIIRDLISCLCVGLASGGGIIIGHELGAGQTERGKDYGIKLAKLSFVCGAISCALMFVFTPISLNFITLTDGAKELLYKMMGVMAFYMIGKSVNSIIINGVFASGGDTLFDLYSLSATMWGIAVPLAALGTFVFGFHPALVYACTCIDEVGKIPWTIHHFRKYKWVKDLTV